MSDMLEGQVALAQDRIGRLLGNNHAAHLVAGPYRRHREGDRGHLVAGGPGPGGEYARQRDFQLMFGAKVRK